MEINDRAKLLKGAIRAYACPMEYRYSSYQPPCVSYQIDNPTELLSSVAHIVDKCSEPADRASVAYLFSKAKWSSLGFGTVIYFPGVTWPETEIFTIEFFSGSDRFSVTVVDKNTKLDEISHEDVAAKVSEMLGRPTNVAFVGTVDSGKAIYLFSFA